MKAKTASERAAEVGDRPDVKAWIAKFQKLASTMPKDVWVFVASGTPCVVANDADGNPIDVADGGAYDYRAGSVVMLCRPCHGDFVARVIARAISCGADVWYVGLSKNLRDDLYGYRTRFKCALRNAGKQSESVWTMGAKR